MQRHTPFEYLFFDSLDDNQVQRLAELPRLVATMRVPTPGNEGPPAYVCLSVQQGESVDDVIGEARQWLTTRGLPRGRRVTFSD
jgi:hypothetical protein